MSELIFCVYKLIENEAEGSSQLQNFGVTLSEEFPYIFSSKEIVVFLQKLFQQKHYSQTLLIVTRTVLFVISL